MKTAIFVLNAVLILGTRPASSLSTDQAGVRFETPPARMWTNIPISATLYPSAPPSAVPAPAVYSVAAVQSADLHEAYDRLLKKYVRASGVRYAQWADNETDRQALKVYIRRLTELDPARLSRTEALAYWINLYNALTLDLILAHYPVDSIRELADGEKTPWQIPRVEVAGRPLTLDEIENAIIRPQFRDARIHFALNCAAVSCPPLAPEAYTGANLYAQLERATRKALRDRRWLRISETQIAVSQIFEWYAQDFIDQAGSIRRFLARYRPDQRATLLDESRELVYMEYVWKLNDASME